MLYDKSNILGQVYLWFFSTNTSISATVGTRSRDRVAVSGDLVDPGTLTPWADFVIIAWGLPRERQSPNALNPSSVLYQMNPDYNIHLVYGEQPEDDREEKWIRMAIDLL